MQNVRVEKLVKRFGDVTAVDGVSFEVPKGKLLTLLGPSGCGKTTTLNIIAGFETPDDGDVHVGERLISSATENVLVPAHKRNLGMVFQSYGLWPHLRVRDNVAFGLQMRKTPRNEIAGAVERALGLVRLDGLGERYPSQLSGGQQQRVAFARALVYEPDVLLLDEPLSNLDAALREEMRLELKELQTESGITTIFVTHDQVEAMVMSDIIVVMNHGRIEQMGSPSDIYQNPRQSIRRRFRRHFQLLGRRGRRRRSGRRAYRGEGRRHDAVLQEHRRVGRLESAALDPARGLRRKPGRASGRNPEPHQMHRRQGGIYGRRAGALAERRRPENPRAWTPLADTRLGRDVFTSPSNPLRSTRLKTSLRDTG